MWFLVTVCTLLLDLDCIHAAVVHKLISSGQLHGSLHGHGDKAVYIPQVYIHMQNKWSDSFLSSNGYLGRLFCIMAHHDINYHSNIRY